MLYEYRVTGIGGASLFLIEDFDDPDQLYLRTGIESTGYTDTKREQYEFS